MSRATKIIAARSLIINLVCSYVMCARKIDDLEEEDDFKQFEDGIDDLLEHFLTDFE